MSTLSCTSCGSRVEVPAGHSRAKIRCGECGYYVEVPEEFRNRAEAEEVQAVAAVTNTKAPKKKLEAPPLIAGTQEEHDDETHPYTVPGDEFKKCAACFKKLPLDATFCVHCGIDFASGKKAKKKFEVIDKSWEPRWGYDLRLKVFLGMQVLNFFIACFSGIAGDSFSAGFTFMVIQGAVQAFLLGSYETLTVKRTTKGAATLWRTWRIAFVPRPPQKIEWKASQGVGIMAIHQPGIIDWIIMVNLLIPAIVPGVLFYWFIIRPDRFYVSLCDVHGNTNDIAFRTTDRDQADEICRTVNDATGLWYKPVL